MGKFWTAAAALALALQANAVLADTAAAPPPGHALTADDLDAFFDGYMPLALGRGDIAGGVVVVVKDGQVLFEKGYGVSDVKTQSPVDPKTTMDRPGTVSKMLT
jgi:CubicO group peptidase (beta-lactamase class C family)